MSRLSQPCPAPAAWAGPLLTPRGTIPFYLGNSRPSRLLRGSLHPSLHQEGLKIPFVLQGRSLGAGLKEFSPFPAGNSSIPAGIVDPRISSPVPLWIWFSQGWIIQFLPGCSSLECSRISLDLSWTFYLQVGKAILRNCPKHVENRRDSGSSRAALENLSMPKIK